MIEFYFKAYQPSRLVKNSTHTLCALPLPAQYDVIAKYVHSILTTAKDIGFTTDIWTSDVSPTSMLSLTAQWLTDEFELKRAILYAQEFPGSHTAAAISVAFENMLEQWHVTKENVHVVIRDNARNMAKAMGQSGVASLGCVAHTLQLTVNEGVFSQ